MMNGGRIKRDRCPSCLQVLRDSPVATRILDVLETQDTWMSCDDLTALIESVSGEPTKRNTVSQFLARQQSAAVVVSRWAPHTVARGKGHKEYRLASSDA